MSLGSGTAEEQVSRLLGDEREQRAVSPGQVKDRPTRRWYGVTVFALLALGLGVIARQPGLLLASAFGVAFAGYGRLTSPPSVELAVERTISDPTPEAGESVQVTLEVTNTSGSTMPDLRLVDGVPSQLTVTSGSPRLATALRPGRSATLSYELSTKRGSHEFEPLIAIARDASGATERVASLEEQTTVTCEPTLPTPTFDFPLRSQTSRYTGRFPADSGGPGLEFYATREYRPGDPLSRIDWKRTARTGEFTTVEYRVERTVSVVLVIDARAEAYRAAGPHEESAVELSVDAARHVYASLAAEGHKVGLAAFSPTDCWLPPSQGDQHQVAVRRLLATHPALSATPTDGEVSMYAAVQKLKGRLPSDSQVVLFSPLCDDHVVGSAIRLDAHGYRTTVVSPDVTVEDSPGHQLANVRRTLRVADLRTRGIPVIDWREEDGIERAMAKTRKRWSQ